MVDIQKYSTKCYRWLKEGWLQTTTYITPENNQLTKMSEVD